MAEGGRRESFTIRSSSVKEDSLLFFFFLFYREGGSSRAENKITPTKVSPPDAAPTDEIQEQDARRQVSFGYR